MNQKPKMRKFREWAEEYFERYEDPAIKGGFLFYIKAVLP